MDVFPGDPEVQIKQIFHLVKDGWNMNLLSLPAHVATHVNVPIHAVEKGKTLDDFTLDAFFGKSTVFTDMKSIKTGVGLFFENAAISKNTLQKILELKPKFVGVKGYFESEEELEVEKKLLKEGIVSFEGLVNVEKLPKNKQFTFYGVPLKIKEGDGSPIRAFAILD